MTRLVDLVLLVTAAEAIFLIAYRRRSARSVALLLLPGVFLMLACRAALDGAAWPGVPAALAAAGIAHVFDLRQRWRR